MASKNTTAADWAKKGFAQINGGTYQQISKAGGRKTATVKKLPVLIPGDMPKPNAKIMNATKVEVNGVKFDSKLEAYLYDALTAAGIEFEFQKVYTLQVGFKYKGETIRPIRIVVDFFLNKQNVVVDTKGWPTPISKLKYKMLKASFIKWHDEPQIFMPSCKEEVNFLITRLKYDKI